MSKFLTPSLHGKIPPNSPGSQAWAKSVKKYLLLLAVAFLLAACGAPHIQQADVTITISADGASQSVTLPTGSTVQLALQAADISLSASDRVEPPSYTTLQAGMTVVVTRVSEEFETRQNIIPFERQELRNESLPSGETRLVQAGQNGLDEVTIRNVFEDGVETGSSVVSEIVLQEAVPEIVMVGVQAPFAPITIPGKLAYLTGGNAWIMENTTSNRRPLVTSGDLDGHVFSLSPDGKWLLFTRKSSLPADQQINTLWVVSTTDQAPTPIDLNVANVVHFADWQPGKMYVIAYSTVEPRSTAPGWQANNDLHLLSFENGRPGSTFDVLEANAGGIYGWWGMSFAWSPNGQSLAYSRPDGIGLVDLSGEQGLTSLFEMTPLNTHGDWAWTPALAWDGNGRALYFVTHAAPTGLVTPEESPNFDLLTFSLDSDSPTALVPQSGMFAYPAVSSLRQDESGLPADRVAFLQAIFPSQSATSRYRLVVMDNDGTNQSDIFPSEGQTGLEPQTPVWAPQVLESGGDFIGVIYEGNLWIVDVASDQSQQVTGDGLTSNIDWK